MGRVAGAVLFIALSPLLAGFMKALGSLISLKLQGEASVNSCLFKDSLKDPMDIFRLPWHEKGMGRIYALLNMLFIMGGGALIFSGGNIALSFLLLTFGEAVRIYAAYAYKGRALEGEIAFTAIIACQLLLIASGFYCYNALQLPEGSFSVQAIVLSGTSPALYMPAMLIGQVLLLIYGSRIDSLLWTSEESTVCCEGCKEKALFETLRGYEGISLYGVLFIINYGGTAASAAISAVICLSVWFLSVLNGRNHSPKPEAAVMLALSAIGMLASFINLFVLL
ncbi:hypothetical protein MASR2M70_04540 [Bacillota bacterium]